MGFERRKTSLKEDREELIKQRAARLARDAKKQGITPEALLKKKRDTYLGVIGGAASMAIPFGPLLKGASLLFKGMGTAAKASKVGTSVVKGAKKVKDAVKKVQGVKSKTKVTPKPKPKADAKPTKSLGTKVKELAATTTGIGIKKGRRSGEALRNKKGQLIGIKKSTIKTGKNIRKGAKIGGPAVIALGTVSQLMKGKDSSKSATAKGMKGGPPQSKGTKKQDFGMGRGDDFSKSRVRRKDNMEGGTAPIADKKKAASKKKEAPKKSKPITAGGNTGFGPGGKIFPSNAEERKKLMNKYGGTGSAAAKAAAQGKQGSMRKVMSA